MSLSVVQMLWAIFFFAGMNLCVKGLHGMPSMEIVFFRCAISIVITFWLLRRIEVPPMGRRDNRWRLWGRGLSGTTALFLFFLTVQKLPLASAVTIQYLSPIFTAILAMLFLKEKLMPVQWLFFGISFAGVAMLKGFDERVSWLYLGIGVLSAFLAGVAYVFVRSMSGREHPLVIVFYFQLVGTMLGGSFTLADFQMPAPTGWMLLLGVGLLAHIAQVKLTKAIQGEKAGVITSLNFLGAIYASIFGWVIFNEAVTWSNVFAMTLVIAGVLLNIIANAGRGQRFVRFAANLFSN
ncbi:MAG: DMT family transporter [Saprospiraceae bacterium]|nr:MAG: DMT family transporter [Saprospiraceae bacterium]